MRQTLLILAAAGTLGGCGTVTPATDARRALEPVHVPVLARQDFAFDAAAPDGMLSSAEAERLDGWFHGLQLTYGDNVYVEGAYSDDARRDVVRVVGRYGLLISNGAPVLAGAVSPGTVRVIVSRTRASVPGCPDWSEPSQPNYNNHNISNQGCGVNANIAAMIANPEDLIHGREGTGTVDAQTASKAIEAYRAQKPTGEGGLKDISTKGK